MLAEKDYQGEGYIKGKMISANQREISNQSLLSFFLPFPRQALIIFLSSEVDIFLNDRASSAMFIVVRTRTISCEAVCCHCSVLSESFLLAQTRSRYLKRISPPNSLRKPGQKYLKLMYIGRIQLIMAMNSYLCNA